jgi:hypothetical protein
VWVWVWVWVWVIHEDICRGDASEQVYDIVYSILSKKMVVYFQGIQVYEVIFEFVLETEMETEMD